MFFFAIFLKWQNISIMTEIDFRALIDEDVNIATMICLVSAQMPRPGAEAVGQGRRLRLLGRLPCSACLAVCCDCACPVALALLLAVFV